MIKLIILALTLATITSCTIKVDDSDIKSAGKFRVEKLFTHEGCTAYRFDAGNRYVYYTNCGTQTQSTYSCGKNCTDTNQVTTY